MERRKSLGRIPDYYLDFENWLPVMHDPSKYFATPAINMVWALAEATRLILQEGLSERWARHQIMANAIHSALETLGLSILAEPSCRSSTVTCVLYPQNLDDQFRAVLDEEGLVVAAGIGQYRGKAFRVGHMGNIDVHDLAALVASLERALNSVGYLSQMGTGVGSLLHSLTKNTSEHQRGNIPHP
jgi:aspartate aminotransferase-like enzyme